MGQKVHPHGFRVGVIKDWDARWTAKKAKFSDFLIEDDKIRKFLKKKLYAAGISKIEIERAANKVSVSIFTGKPGIVIGKGGAGVEILKADLLKLTGKNVVVNIIEVKRRMWMRSSYEQSRSSGKEDIFPRAMKQSIGRR
jgi:small subunit ribosomal protein S3